MSITLPKTPLLNTWLFIFYDLFYKETESYISEFYQKLFWLKHTQLCITGKKFPSLKRNENPEDS